MLFRSSAWNDGFVKCLGLRLAGDQIGDVDERGEPIVGDTFLILLNAHHEPLAFHLPATKAEHVWEAVFDTAVDRKEALYLEGEQEYPLRERSLTVLRTRLREEEAQRISGVQVEVQRKEALEPVLPRQQPTLAPVG